MHQTVFYPHKHAHRKIQHGPIETSRENSRNASTSSSVSVFIRDRTGEFGLHVARSRRNQDANRHQPYRDYLVALFTGKGESLLHRTVSRTRRHKQSLRATHWNWRKSKVCSQVDRHPRLNARLNDNVPCALILRTSTCILRLHPRPSGNAYLAHNFRALLAFLRSNQRSVWHAIAELISTEIMHITNSWFSIFFNIKKKFFLKIKIVIKITTR